MSLVGGFGVFPEKGASTIGRAMVCRGELAGMAFTVAIFPRGEDGLTPALLSRDAKGPLPKGRGDFSRIFAGALAGRFDKDGSAHLLDGSPEAVSALTGLLG